MRQLGAKLVALLQTTRPGIVTGSVCQVWLVALLSRADPRYHHLPVCELPLVAALAVTAAATIGLVTFGAALNDFLDSRHDQAFSPDRPIPAGRLRGPQVLVLALCALLVALLAGLILGSGSELILIGAAAAIVFFNAAAKHMPGIGLVVIGFIHCAMMMVANPQLTFTLPLGLAMTHAVAVAALVHHLEQKRPALSWRATVAALAGWLLSVAVVIGAGAWRNSGGDWLPSPPLWLLLPPLAAIAGFLLLLRFRLPAWSSDRAGARLARLGALWQAVYAVAWLLGAELNVQAAMLALFALLAFGGIALLREVAVGLFTPLTWRG